MGRGKALSEEERGYIRGLRESGLKYKAIALKVGRSDRVVRNYLRNPDLYGTKKSTGRPKALSKRDESHIVRLASNKAVSARQIHADVKPKCSERTVRRCIVKSKILKRKKYLTKPQLSVKHKQARLDWAREHMSWTDEWLNVIFTDEKKFNLDGPDGWMYYYHDLRKEQQLLSKRQMGGGSVMIWAGIGYNGILDVCFVPQRMNSQNYAQILDEYLLPKAEEVAGDQWTLQQDNAPCHSSKATTKWLQDRQIRSISWPSRSPDLNIIENIWGILARKVYRNCRQFSSQAELKTAILDEWY
jgi:transposase